MRQCVTAVEGCRGRTQCEERCEYGGMSIHECAAASAHCTRVVGSVASLGRMECATWSCMSRNITVT